MARAGAQPGRAPRVGCGPARPELLARGTRRAPPTSRFPAANATRARGARRQRFVVPRASLAALQRFARAEELTLFQVLLGGFFLLLSKYTGQDDLVIGTPLLGRVHGDSLRDLGYFVNLAPVRVRGIDQIDIRDLLRQTKRSLEGCQRHQAIRSRGWSRRWAAVRAGCRPRSRCCHRSSPAAASSRRSSSARPVGGCGSAR
ncbi:condensation domain-containing protein [Nannocystis pusilla]|uniref:condensation domain-containing protein n=1 Tax=Nannocystis pusilla TaxID=889268 RepID=UPI003B7C522E